jgi:3-phytase
MRYSFTLGCMALALAGCAGEIPQTDAATSNSPAVIAATRTSEPTFWKQANDAAVWRNAADPEQSVLLVSAGEAGLELHSLGGKRLARFETIEAGFVEVPDASGLPAAFKGLVLATDQRLGAVRAFAFDPATRQLQDITAAPLEVADEITGLCTYTSPLTGKLYAYVATDQGQLEQWELFERDRKVAGRIVRRIPAGKGVAHCTVDDIAERVYFSEESVGIWSVAAEPESDAARQPVDLIEPRGALHEEVKGLAIYRADASKAYLLARDAGAGAFMVYPLDGAEPKQFSIGGAVELGDAEGLTIVTKPLGKDFPLGVLVIADEDAGDYKFVSLQALTSQLSLPTPGAIASAPGAKVATVQPRVETEPAASYGDAADDPAIWTDPADPARSVVIATDKKLGLNVYDLSGNLLQTLADGRMNNVDVRDGFMLGGRPITVVAATNRTTKSISLYRFDPAARRLSSIAAGVLPSGFADPYGLCMYHSRKSGAFYVLANDSVDGKVRQWKLVERDGRVVIEPVRDIDVGSQAEGCVADDELGHLYVAEEDVGLWKYGAEPDSGDRRAAVDTVDQGNLKDDVEGVSIYYGANGGGFLVVSNQGEDNYAVYRREGANEYIGKFHVVANSEFDIDGASETDGLDIVSTPLGSQFPAGLLGVQDGRNLLPAARQNFKYVSWQDALQALQRK